MMLPLCRGVWRLQVSCELRYPMKIGDPKVAVFHFKPAQSFAGIDLIKHPTISEVGFLHSAPVAEGFLY